MAGGGGVGGAPCARSPAAGRARPARPSPPQGRVGGGGTRSAQPPAGESSKSCVQTFPNLLLSSPSPAVELEPGGDRRDSGKEPAPLPRGAERGWLPLGPEHKLTGSSRDTRPASPTPHWEEEPRPPTGTWCAVISALEGLVHFRELERRESRSVPFLHLPAASEEQICGWGSQWENPKQDRCVEPRHSG